MKSMLTSIACRLVAALALSTLVIAPALAQDAPAAGDQPQQQAAAPRKPVTPTVMKTFGGWDVRCYPVSSPAPCDMWEAIAFKNGGQLAVSISIVYVPSQDAHLLQLIVPLGVDFAAKAKIMTDTFTSDAFPYHHCDRIGCYIVVPQGNAVVDALKDQQAMKVRVTQFRGKSIDLAVPLKGFADAHSAMVELAKQKAANPAPASPSP
jgi:invasion protein IalB